MGSLEIRTQRIFNNLIKQRQKLDSDSVLEQSTTVSSVQSPASSVQRPKSSIQSLASRLQRLESRAQHLRPESRNSCMPCPPTNSMLTKSSVLVGRFLHLQCISALILCNKIFRMFQKHSTFMIMQLLFQILVSLFYFS